MAFASGSVTSWAARIIHMGKKGHFPPKAEFWTWICVRTATLEASAPPETPPATLEGPSLDQTNPFRSW